MPSFTLSALEQRVWDSLDDNRGFFPEGNVRSVLMEGLRRLNLLTGFQERTIPVAGATVANQLIYRTPPDITIPLRVYFESVELNKASLREIATKFRTWSTDSTATRGPVTRWAPIDIRQFIIHPMDAVGGQLLEVNGIARLTPLVNQTDVIQLDDQYCDLLIDFAKSRILYKEGSKIWADGSTLSYSEWVRKVKAWSVWQGVRFSRYYLTKEEEPAESKGVA